jgi:uncharacterized integral membrane protein
LAGLLCFGYIYLLIPLAFAIFNHSTVTLNWPPSKGSSWPCR